MTPLKDALKKALGIPAPSPDDVRAAEELSLYFQHLGDRFQDIDVFKANWLKVPAYVKAPHEIMGLLKLTAKHVQKFKQDVLRQQCHEFVQENFSFFETAFWSSKEKYTIGKMIDLLMPLADHGIKASEDFLTLWQSRARPLLERASLADLTDIVLAFVKLDVKPSTDFMVDWQERAYTALKETKISGRRLADLMWGLSKLRLQPSAKFIALWEAQTMPRLANMSERDFVSSIYSPAKLGIKPSAQFMDVWQREAMQKLKSFNLQDIAIAYWSLGVHDAMGTKNTHPAAEILYANACARQWTDFEDRQIHSVFQASQWFGWPTTGMCPYEEGQSSNGEADLQAAFKRAGFESVSQMKMVGMEHCVDLALMGSHPIMVEYDGPYHFNYEIGFPQNPLFDGGTLFQSALISKIAGSPAILLRVPYTLKRDISRNSLQEQEQYLRQIMAFADTKTSGAYVVGMNQTDSTLRFDSLLKEMA